MTRRHITLNERASRAIEELMKLTNTSNYSDAIIAALSQLLLYKAIEWGAQVQCMCNCAQPPQPPPHSTPVNTVSTTQDKHEVRTNQELPEYIANNKWVQIIRQKPP